MNYDLRISDFCLMRIKVAILMLLWVTAATAQNIPIGQWRSHLTYSEGLKLAEVKDKIYIASTEGLYSVRKSDYQIQPLSRVQGFSDVFTHTLFYAPNTDMLFIGYRNAGMDILHGN